MKEHNDDYGYIVFDIVVIVILILIVQVWLCSVYNIIHYLMSYVVCLLYHSNFNDHH